MGEELKTRVSELRSEKAGLWSLISSHFRLATASFIVAAVTNRSQNPSLT